MADESRSSSDALLLLRAAEGDQRAFEIFYRRHACWLIVRLQSRCPDSAIVDDVLQEAFLGAWTGAGRFRAQSEDGQAGAWLWRIAERRLAEHGRRNNSRLRLLQRLSRFRPQYAVEPSAEAVALDLRTGPELDAALDGLPPELREVLQATLVDGRTTRETAELLRLPEGTVKTRAMRARRRLKEALS
ncbi:RNA polymerase sigma factor [Streptomyces sp. MS06]|uniref:RNA polymerase sigma factor n=1 Tax=Streptomyces sp. MS06 TaxID=3385974 RepID=UPI0039A165D0